MPPPRQRSRSTQRIRRDLSVGGLAAANNDEEAPEQIVQQVASAVSAAVADIGASLSRDIRAVIASGAQVPGRGTSAAFPTSRRRRGPEMQEKQDFSVGGRAAHNDKETPEQISKQVASAVSTAVGILGTVLSKDLKAVIASAAQVPSRSTPAAAEAVAEADADEEPDKKRHRANRACDLDEVIGHDQDGKPLVDFTGVCAFVLTRGPRKGTLCSRRMPCRIPNHMKKQPETEGFAIAMASPAPATKASSRVGQGELPGESDDGLNSPSGSSYSSSSGEIEWSPILDVIAETIVKAENAAATSLPSNALPFPLRPGATP